MLWAQLHDLFSSKNWVLVMISIGIIPARGGSKSVPKKNIIMLKDKPLIAYSILASLESKVSETWVSTDDEDIKSVSKEWGAKVIDRPKELATDTILNELVNKIK